MWRDEIRRCALAPLPVILISAGSLGLMAVPEESYQSGYDFTVSSPRRSGFSVSADSKRWSLGALRCRPLGQGPALTEPLCSSLHVGTWMYVCIFTCAKHEGGRTSSQSQLKNMIPLPTSTAVVHSISSFNHHHNLPIR
ncbi:unnamed protein product [Pleuronectes platessa]|uniref:Uncharacterized protein n=1 Tax=Pleuronectes platessa TaxID=8262 RepID=A0A9N7VLI1_PLEPL|nr:unnamed protein product [Pleuronectes platessa]